MSVSVEPQTDPLELIPVAEPVRPNEDTVVKILKRVRTRLEHHWTQGKLNDGAGNYCLLGAVMKETVGFAPMGGSEPWGEWKYWVPKINRNYRRITRALRHEQGIYTYRGLINFNDEHTKDSILNMIDRTIAERERVKELWRR